LNKTILTRDPYDGIGTTEMFLCDIVARMAWGKVHFKEDAEAQAEEEDEDGSREAQKYLNATWELISEELSFDSPDADLINYRQYLDK